MPPQRRKKSTVPHHSKSPSSSPSTNPPLTTLARYHTAHLLNPTIDRTPALLHTPDNSKLTITINCPGNHVSVSSYGFEVDWSNRGSVGSLNEWRSWYFDYWFGSVGAISVHTQLKRSAVVRYCEEERDWLQRLVEGKRVASWEDVANGFNAEFEGLVLDGNSVPRPKRTANQLKALHRSMRNQNTETSKAETSKTETSKVETSGAETSKAETKESEQDYDSEMDEWEREVITRFGERVRRDREEKRRKC